jgi:hypothetical protein
MENCQNVADILFKTRLTLCKFHNAAGVFYILISFKLRVFKSVTTFREPDKCREYLGLELGSTALISASIYSCYVGKFINFNSEIFVLSAGFQCYDIRLMFS